MKCLKTKALITAIVSFSAIPAVQAQYGYRMKLTIESARVSGASDHSNFPVLISLTDSVLATTGADGGNVENPNGWDISFRASDGITKLDFEVEKYTSSPGSGTLVAWVRIPTLSTSADTDIYIYYGNPDVACSQENPAGVWGANYKGVWHLNEDPTGPAPQFADSTFNRNHGTAGSIPPGNPPTSDVGKINESLAYDDNPSFELSHIAGQRTTHTLEVA